VLLAATGIVTAALYFAGSQFQYAKARALGLAASPVQSSFHETVALGATVIEAKFIVVAAAAITVTYIGLRLLEWGVAGIGKRVSRLVRQSDELEIQIVEAEERAKRNELTPQDTRNLRRQLTRLKMNKGLSRGGVTALSVALNLFGILLMVLAGLLLVTFWYAGSTWGKETVEDARRTLRSSCEECRNYLLKTGVIRGVVMFQTDDRLFVETRNGLIVAKVDDLLVVESGEGRVLKNKAGQQTRIHNSTRPPSSPPAG
jgi:hypothetical protein